MVSSWDATRQDVCVCKVPAEWRHDISSQLPGSRTALASRGHHPPWKWLRGGGPAGWRPVKLCTRLCHHGARDPVPLCRTWSVFSASSGGRVTPTPVWAAGPGKDTRRPGGLQRCAAAPALSLLSGTSACELGQGWGEEVPGGPVICRTLCFVFPGAVALWCMCVPLACAVVLRHFYTGGLWWWVTVWTGGSGQVLPSVQSLKMGQVALG